MSKMDTMAPAETAVDRGGKYLTFHLAGEEYGIEILKVNEIIGMLPITRVPRMPEAVRGVVNLRGKVIPVIDLRRRFLMAATEDTSATCIIVVQVRGTQTGVVVDTVSDVVDIHSDDVLDTPSFGADVNTDYLLGIARSESRVRLLLDIERVLAEHAVSAHAALEAEPEPQSEHS
jgi:purine-binding chemotaxis protein CheW